MERWVWAYEGIDWVSLRLSTGVQGEGFAGMTIDLFVAMIWVS